MHRLVYLLALFATSGVAAISAPTNPVALSELAGPAQPGIVRIRCRLGPIMRFFRGSVMATGQGNAAWDVVLTTLHGLPDDIDLITDRCVVVDGFGHEIGLREMWRPPLRGLVSTSDWAVLLTRERIERIGVRLSFSADPYRELLQLARSSAPVRLPMLNPAAETDCNLIPSELTAASAAPTIFAHTCRTWPGHSGSPILADVDGRLLILGIHLGRRRNHLAHTAYGVGRLIDSTIVAAIDAAIARGMRE